MPNPHNVMYAAGLLRTRPELNLETPIATFIGDNPTPGRLSEAALAVAQPDILLPYLDALLHDASGTTFAENQAFMLVSDDRQGGQIESLHALTIAKGDQWDARVHVWMEGRRLTEDLHTHRSAFGSVILAGAVALRPVRHRTFTAGQNHTMPHTMIHSAQVNPKGLTATVVVRHRRDTTSHGYTDGPRTTTFPRVERVDGLDTLRRLRTTLSDT
jgi:hypothetical protein